MADGRGLRRRITDAIARARRRWRGVEPRTTVEIRCERASHGGWWLCPQAIRPGDVVYSFTVGGDLRFETEVAERYGARVHVFDPDPATADRAAELPDPDRLRFFPMTVGARNEHRDVVLPGSRVTEARALRLPAHMRNLGHRRLDLIRLDVPGVEGDVIRDLVTMEVDVHQLLLAFHEERTVEARDRIEAGVATLGGHGYRVFHISPDRREFSFIRTDFAGP